MPNEPIFPARPIPWWRKPARILRIVLIFLFACLATFFLLGLAYASIQPPPGIVRDWVPLQARTPEISRSGSIVTISSIRDFSYSSADAFTPRYISGSYDADSITSAWFVLTPFYSSWRGPAHSFVSFGFSDGRYLSISVEARRQVGETYSPLKGQLNQFELIYIVGTERDLIGSRAAFAPYPVYLYPISAPPARIRSVFLEMTARASALASSPEYYNTFLNNCTSNVVAHVNDVTDRKVPFSVKTLLPGYIDEVAFSRGLIAGVSSLDEARSRFRIDPAIARAYMDSGSFSSAIRAPFRTP